jgi:hypothetical protein
LKDNIDLIDLTDIYRVLYPATAQCTLFSALLGTFSKIDHILDHKAYLNKRKKIKIIPCILSDDNTIKLEVNNKRNNRKYSNNWMLNNTFLQDHWVIEEVKEEIKKS